jgi:hypothetical protein
LTSGARYRSDSLMLTPILNAVVIGAIYFGRQRQ